VAEIVSPHDGTTLTIDKGDMLNVAPSGSTSDDGLRAIRTRTVPAEDGVSDPTYIVSVCSFPGCNRKQEYIEHDLVFDESIEFCEDFGERSPDSNANRIAGGWETP
jgi:hypothetical protein